MTPTFFVALYDFMAEWDNTLSITKDAKGAVGSFSMVTETEMRNVLQLALYLLKERFGVQREPEKLGASL